MDLWIIRLAMLVTFPLALWGCWSAAGWLIRAGLLPGASNPNQFGYFITQAFGACIVMMAFAILMNIFAWLAVWRPREKAKHEFWRQRGKSWPR